MSVDSIRLKWRNKKNHLSDNIKMVETSHGLIRVFDSNTSGPIILTSPDGPNVIEHHLEMMQKLSTRFRVICFDLPGFGFSHPKAVYDYRMETGADLILSIIKELKLGTVSLSYSCANGYYAMLAAKQVPDRIEQLILVQTPGRDDMIKWTKTNVPDILKQPIIGGVANGILEYKLAHKWYNYALPKNTDRAPYQQVATRSLHNGGCFCLSAFVRGLSKDLHKDLLLQETPCTMVWGGKDFTHRHSTNESILEHIPKCEVVVFPECGHFPDLEAPKDFVELVMRKIG